MKADTANLLKNRGETVATAESATGGLVASKFTDIPGASDYFDRGIVAYTYRAKMEELGVNKETLEDKTAVCRGVAKQMAQGVRDLADTNWGISITGYAGPKAGSEPVGTVYIGVAYHSNEQTFAEVHRYQLEDGREELKDRFAEKALETLKLHLEEIE